MVIGNVMVVNKGMDVLGDINKLMLYWCENNDNIPCVLGMRKELLKISGYKTKSEIEKAYFDKYNEDIKIKIC